MEDVTFKQLNPAKMLVPKRPNYELVAQYKHSKIQTRGLKISYIPDSLEKNYKVRDLHLKINLNTIEHELSSKKELAAKQREVLNKKWDQLAEKEELLRSDFIKFNKFVRENIEKRNRANLKIIEQNETYKNQLKKLTKLKGEIEDVTKTKDGMETKINEYLIYQAYLISVCESHPEFKTIQDLVKRYETLLEAKKNLSINQEKIFSELENAKTVLFNYVQNKQVQVLDLKRKLSTLSERYENAKHSVAKWEITLNNVKLETGKQALETMAVQQASKALCTAMHKGRALKSGANEEQQLQCIKQSFVNMERTANAIRKLEEKQAKLSMRVAFT